MRETLLAAVARAVARAQAEGKLPDRALPTAQLDVPPVPALGDFSTNIAVLLARETGQAAPDIAALIRARLEPLPDLLHGVEITGAGFLNFFLTPGWLALSVARIVEEQGRYGCSSGGAGRSALLEFVSAPPTGPLSVTHGRGAVLGDALARMLGANGWEVARECYVNDAGSHMDRFGRSLEAHGLRGAGRRVPLPVDRFDGPHFERLARRLAAETSAELLDLSPSERQRAFAARGRDVTIGEQAVLLQGLGVTFNAWPLESALLSNGRLSQVIERLRERDRLRELEGALWLDARDLGDTELRALIRSNRQPSYLAGDLAYHFDKFSRGFDLVLDLWGSDHALYAQRTRSGLRALDLPVDALEIRIFEPVAVKRDGVPVDRSPFSGNTHPLDEVIEQIGKEATRFFLLATPLDRPLDLDLGVAARGGVANPLQRLLGAHRQARELSNTGADAGLSDRIRSLDHPAAAPLMHALLEYPGRLAAATESRDPARLIQYLQHLAAAWEPLTSEPEPAATLGAPVAVVLENALRTLGLSTGA